MKVQEYKAFSRRIHGKKRQDLYPRVCEFELTFACGLRCKHCYTDCYNSPDYVRKQLDTAGVMRILDQAYEIGVIWLCFTGGDPLVRPDFGEIYRYAKGKGFIITLFTNACAMDARMKKLLAAYPPFNIEVTVNSSHAALYEEISQVRGSFSLMMKGLTLIRGAGLPLRIKSLITSLNVHEIPALKKFVRQWGSAFIPDYSLMARLNGDTSPCDLRLLPDSVISLDKTRKHDRCAGKVISSAQHGRRLFPCTIDGGAGIKIDPSGKVIPCVAIREPSFETRDSGLLQAYLAMFHWTRSRSYRKEAACAQCDIAGYCGICAGKAMLETGNMEDPSPYYCDLAQKRKEAGVQDE